MRRNKEYSLSYLLDGHTDKVNSVAFSYDSNYIASGSRDGTVKVWDLRTGKLIRTLNGDKFNVISVAFSRDGSKIVSGGDDKSVKVWNTMTGELTHTLRGHTDRVNSVAFSANDDHIIVSGSDDKTVNMWSVTTGILLRSLKNHTDCVNSVACCYGGILSGSDDKTIKLWDHRGLLVHTFTFDSRVVSVAIDYGGHTIVGGCSDGNVIMYLGSLEKPVKFDDHRLRVGSVAISSDGSKIVSRSNDTSVKVRDIVTGTVLTLDASSDDKNNYTNLYSVAISPDSSMIAFGGTNKTVDVWRKSL